MDTNGSIQKRNNTSSFLVQKGGDGVGADKELIRFGAKCELARRSFFYYCKCKGPDFYNEDRPYIVDLCNELQNFYESDEEVLIVNMPPR